MRSFGWLKGPPDARDWTANHPDVVECRKKLYGLAGAPKNAPPKKVDLRKWCSEVEDQGRLGSCTAHAAMSIVEYFQRRAFGKHLNGSRLFVYKVTRNLMGARGDTGAYLVDTMKALAAVGVPPERYWQYTDKGRGWDDEPSAFLYAMAQNFQAMKYYRHDTRGVELKQVLRTVKIDLALGIPAMFGFWYFGDDPDTGVFAPPRGRAMGGHAVAAVGYDDEMDALLVRNSWGTGWGDNGYGWLPYEYVLQGLADEFWSITQVEWLDWAKLS